MNILLLGDTQFIGRHIAEALLFRPEGGPHSSLMDVSNEQAHAAGLVLTDPAITAADTRAWLHDQDLPLALAPEREAELIRQAKQRSAGTEH
ncbi:MAG: hypothetical protein OHK0022_08950 [Roseiflexaceae bacterium]